jgi:hypothetical protein
MAVRPAVREQTIHAGQARERVRDRQAIKLDESGDTAH